MVAGRDFICGGSGAVEGKDGRKSGKPQVEAADTRLSLLDLAIMDDRGYCVCAVT